MPKGVFCKTLSELKQKKADEAAKYAKNVTLSDGNHMTKDINNTIEAKKKYREDYHAQYY